MGMPLELGLLLLFLVSLANGFLNGFPVERCDDMDPTLIPIQESKDDWQDFNNTEYDEPPPTSIHPSDRLNLYRIVTSPSKYRRGKVLEINVRGRDFNGMMLQVRKIGADERRGFDQVVRVGEFIEWPTTLQPVKCDQGKVTALTHKNFATKSDISIKWKAPQESVGEIHVVGRFIYGSEYWQLSESREIPMNEFPPNLKRCGKAHSCVMYSEKKGSCHEDDCDYILSYRIVNHTLVEFTLGGNTKGENSYLAVGFSEDSKIDKIKMVACTRSKTAAEIKYFVVSSSEQNIMEFSDQSLDHQKMDLDGKRMWCSFTVPFDGSEGEDGNGLNLKKPFYHLYLRGSSNHTKTVNIPVLPDKPFISKKEMAIDKILVHYLKEEGKKKSHSSTLTLDYFLFATAGVILLYMRL